MLKFTIKRVLYSILILFFVMFLIYILMYNMPMGYIETKARELASRPGATKSYAEWLADLNAQYGMDKGVVLGYLTWLKNAFKGNWGDSWAWTIPVTEEFHNTVWYSFILGFVSFIFEIIIAIPLGITAAKKQYSFTDYFTTVISMICISMPTFFIATLLKYVFSVKLGWFDLSGMQGRNYMNLSDFGKFLDVAKHFVLPSITIIIISIGGLMRYTRTNMLEVLSADYIRTARAKGVPEKKVINYHAFRNTLIPLVTMLGGSLPGLFSGALITETLFSIRGIGYASYTSMTQGDIPFIMFYLAFISILTLLGNLISDLLYAVVDPRVRLS
ncbi:MAG: ABC transporter permease [Lachnospiraceae bacterium]|nr:ABC transporter permease [Lachnospiraceae bacterium]MBR2996721.1 ABC transporter permease [Lachnospiraceae bacterium]